MTHQPMFPARQTPCKSMCILFLHMDSKPEWFAWGLKDLRDVKGVEYSVSLSNPRPIFARQYHLAHCES